VREELLPVPLLDNGGDAVLEVLEPSDRHRFGRLRVVLEGELGEHLVESEVVVLEGRLLVPLEDLLAAPEDAGGVGVVCGESVVGVEVEGVGLFAVLGEVGGRGQAEVGGERHDPCVLLGADLRGPGRRLLGLRTFHSLHEQVLGESLWHARPALLRLGRLLLRLHAHRLPGLPHHFALHAHQLLVPRQRVLQVRVQHPRLLHLQRLPHQVAAQSRLLLPLHPLSCVYVRGIWNFNC